MKKPKIQSLIILLTINMYGCQSLHVSVSTDPPQAKIEFFDPESKTFKQLATSPTVINQDSNLPESVLDEDLIIIAIKKPGFNTERLVLHRANDANTSIEIKLQPSADVTEEVGKQASKSEINQNQLATEISQALVVIHRQIQAKKYQAAIAELARIISRYPEAPPLWDIKGSLHYLQGEKDLATTSYEKSLQLEPENQEARQMLDRLQKQR